jgi:hypothetical protein
VQVGLIPVAAMVDIQNPQIITDYCISAHEAVNSVFIFANNSIDEIHTIYLDTHSRSSNNLAKILLKYFWKKEVEFKDRTIDIVSLKDAVVGEGYGEVKRLSGKYCEPNFDDLGVKMMEVYNNYEVYKERALIDSAIIRSIFTWENVAKVANDYIMELEQPKIINEKTYDTDFAYVTCGNENYMSVIEKMVQSLLEFSTRKILVYGINCDVPFDYPNVIKKRLDIPTFSEHDKWYWKQLSYLWINSCSN